MFGFSQIATVTWTRIVSFNKFGVFKEMDGTEEVNDTGAKPLDNLNR